MFHIINGQITLVQYFMTMVLSTLVLVSVVAGAYFLPHDKNAVAILVMLLSIVSLISSGQIINLCLRKKDY